MNTANKLTLLRVVMIPAFLLLYLDARRQLLGPGLSVAASLLPTPWTATRVLRITTR